MSHKLKIAIAAGGTAGHVVPALAVAAALRADGAEVAFIGAGRAEATLVPAAGYQLHAISVEGLSRSNPLRALRALLRAALAVPRARALLRQLAPDAVVIDTTHLTQEEQVERIVEMAVRARASR